MVMDQQPDLLYLLHDYKSLSVSTTHVSKIFQTQIYKQNGDSEISPFRDIASSVYIHRYIYEDTAHSQND